MRDHNNPITGTFYIKGEQVHFESAVAKALDLDCTDNLTFNITIDLLQSLKNGDITYRVNYVMGR